MAGKVVTKPTPSVSKIDQFIERQLSKTSARVRWLDALSLLLGFLILVFGYATVMLGLEYIVELPTAARIVGFSLFAVGVVAFLIFAIVPFLRSRVNPYYSAICIEETIPEGKDSLINWLDVQQNDVPVAFRQAMGLRAATDIKKADLVEAGQDRTPVWLGCVLTTLVLLLGVVFLFSPARFSWQMARAFAPFQAYAPPPTVTIHFKKPVEAKHYVLLNRPVLVQVQIYGDVGRPGSEEAPRLEYRYPTAKKYVTKPLELVGRADWDVTLSGDEIQYGVYYRIVAGGVATKERQIIAQPAPQVLAYEIESVYPAYLNKSPTIDLFNPNEANSPTLKFLQGTKVTFQTLTNRELKAGYLELHQGQDTQKLVGQSPAEHREKIHFSALALRESGSFRLGFTPTFGSPYLESNLHAFAIVEDQSPKVELEIPAEKSIERPANGTVILSGKVADDFGVRSVILRMKVTPDKGTTLAIAKPFVEPVDFAAETFSFGKTIDYADFLELEKLHKLHPEMSPLQAKTKIEYWLEARDNCTYPKGKEGNVSESEHKWILITKESDSPEQQEKLRQQAQKQHDDATSKLQQKSQDNAFNNSVKDLLNPNSTKGKPENNPKPPKNSKPESNNKKKNETKKDKESNDGKGKGKDEKKPGEDGKGKDEKKSGDNKSGKGKDGDEKKKEQQSQAKDGGEKANESPGDAKGADKSDTKSDSQPKDGSAKGMEQGKPDQAKAKQGGEDGPSSQAKGPSDQANSKPNPGTGTSKKEGKPLDPNVPEEKQIIELVKKGQSSDQSKRKQAIEELDKIANDAESPRISDAARQASDSLKKGDGDGPPNSPGTGNDGTKQGEGNGQSSPAKTGETGTGAKVTPGNGPRADGQPNGQKADVPTTDGQQANEKFLEMLNNLQLEDLETFKEKLRDTNWSNEKQQWFIDQLKTRLQNAKAKGTKLFPPGQGKTNLLNQRPQELSKNKDNPSGSVANLEGVEPTEYLRAFQKVLQRPRK